VSRMGGTVGDAQKGMVMSGLVSEKPTAGVGGPFLS